MAILKIHNLHKSFGSKKVHNGVSFELKQGEVLALFGGSGTGKSVILRSIIGLETPDAGEILYRSSPITGLSEEQYVPIRTKISYVFQNGALFDSLSVEDNLAYPLREHTSLSPSAILDRVNEMLELVDMTGSNQLLPGELSGGMQKRAGLARATILNPEITLFDEPTAGLDPINTRRLVENIKKLKKKGMTGIFVTHDIPAALELADRIAILHKGVIQINDTTEAIRHSSDPLVQSFLQGTHE